MRLVLVTQTIDADHPVLAHTVELVRELASRFAQVTVICASVGEHDLPENVRFRVFGAPTRPGRGLSFLRALVGELTQRPRPDAVFAHMVPLFAVLAAPFLRPLGVPLLLWYTQWHASRTLAFATRLVDVVVTAHDASFPIRSSKVRAIGHAIDVERFSPRHAQPSNGTLRLVALGRYAPVKGYATLLEGLRLAVEAGIDARLEVHGPVLTNADRRHRAELECWLADTPTLNGRVTLAGPVLHAEVPGLLRRFDALVSTTQPDESETFDKVLCEAAACGVLVVASNRALDEFLGGLPVELRFPAGAARGLASVLGELAAADHSLRTAVSNELRRRVVTGHSLAAWADAVAAIVRLERRE